MCRDDRSIALTIGVKFRGCVRCWGCYRKQTAVKRTLGLAAVGRLLLASLATSVAIVGIAREVRSNCESPIAQPRSDTVQLSRDFPKVRGIVRDKWRSPSVRTFPRSGAAKPSRPSQKSHSAAFDVAVPGGMPRRQRATVDRADRSSSQQLRCSKVSENAAVLTNRVFPVELRIAANATEFACGGLCSRLSLPLV